MLPYDVNHKAECALADLMTYDYSAASAESNDFQTAN
jgi:hypothetical protein